ATELTIWTINCLVLRDDAFGCYLPPAKRTSGRDAARTAKLMPTPAVLERHFRGEDPRHIVGVHAITPVNDLSQRLAIDIDFPRVGAVVPAEIEVDGQPL